MGQEIKQNEGQVHSQLTLIELLKKDPANVQAWAMLAKLVDSPERKKIYIDKALALEPDNKDLQEQARKLGVDTQQKMVAPVPVEKPIESVVETETIVETVADDSPTADIAPAVASVKKTVEPVDELKTQVPIPLEDKTESTLVSEPTKVEDVVEQTIVSEEDADIQNNTKIQSTSGIEETIEKEPNVTADPTIEVEADVQPAALQEVSQADDARMRVQEILSALGVKSSATNAVETADSKIINNIDETKVIADNPSEETVLESISRVDQDTIVQDFSELSQKDTILEADVIIDDPLATIAQDLSVEDTVVGEQEVVIDAAQQRIDQIRDSIKPMEEPAFKVQEPEPSAFAPVAAPMLPSGVEDFGEETAVIEPPSRILQGLLAIASIIAFSFFAYELIEFMNNATGFAWPDYR